MKPITNYISVLFVCVTCMLIYSCKDFIEPSISDRNVQINAPANNFQSTSYTVNFWWNEVEDALTYRLQIVTPSFNSPSALITDTLVKGNKFSFNLIPGDYEWRLRAENGSTQTSYATPNKFSVLFSSIKQQKVTLLLPGNNTSINQTTTTFSWNSLYGATKYRLQVDTNNFSDAGKVVYEQVTPALQTNYALTKDQVYQWRIRAENDTVQAQWSPINSFTFDHTPPVAPNLISPADNQLVNAQVSLQWSQPVTAVRYKLYIYKSDSTTPYNTSFPMLLTGTGFNFNQGIFGERIFWKVSAVDAAGNESAASVLRSFLIQ